MWEYFEAGGPVMWPLLACSVLALTVVLERAWFWFRLNIDTDHEVIEKILKVAEQGGELPGTKSIAGRMLVCGVMHREYAYDRAMEDLAAKELHAMGRGMVILDTIITVAPMLGILGTVTGIIGSFDMLGQAGVEDPKSVVSGIAEALITTATGLIISIPTVFPYNYFNSRIVDAQKKLESYGTRLELVMNGGARQ